MFVAVVVSRRQLMVNLQRRSERRHREQKAGEKQ
jgi:hypothetical protein